MTWTIYNGDMAPSNAEENTSDTSLTFSPTAAVPTQVLAILLFQCDNVDTSSADNTTFASITDTKSNTWFRAAEAQYSAGGVLDGILAGVYYSVVATQIETSDSITVTLTANATSKGAALAAFNRDTSATISVPDKQYQRIAASADYTVTISGLASQEYLFIGHNTMETSTGSTNNVDLDYGGVAGNILQGGGPWGTSGGGAANTAGRGGYRILTATGDTFNRTGNAVADRVTILAAFKETAAAGGTVLDPFGMSGFFGG